MFVSSCPLRVSLVGGSTDNPEFLKKYKKGSVINFASNLRVYTIAHEDVFGYNKIYDKFVINYSERECVTEIDEIKNELFNFVTTFNSIRSGVPKKEISEEERNDKSNSADLASEDEESQSEEAPV